MEILDGPVRACPDEDAFPSALPVRRGQAWAAWVTIQIGCDNNCAFCIVPAVRGPEVSRPFGQIVAEVETLAAAGTVEVTPARPERQLLRPGPHHPACGRAPDWQAASPPDRTGLGRGGPAPGPAAVRRSAAWPWLRSKVSAGFALPAPTPRICGPRRSRPWPPNRQSAPSCTCRCRRAATGSWPACTGATPPPRYLERLAAARAAIDDLAVTTDIIVGFPGETEADFEQTLEVVAEAAYDSAYTFVYSPRPGTEAATQVDEMIPADVAADRFERLRIVVERSALARHQARVGRTEEILVEGPSKRDPGVVSGRTAQGKLVHVPAGPGTLPAGTWADVRITRAAPHFLTGELLAVTARPAHRTRIPVVAG